MKQIKNKTYTINMAEIPDKGNLLIIDGDTKEYISFDGFESPVIDKKGKVIKTGKLLNVSGNIHQCKPTTKKTTKKQLFPKLFADIVDCAGRRMVNDMLNVKDKL